MATYRIEWIDAQNKVIGSYYIEKDTIFKAWSSIGNKMRQSHGSIPPEMRGFKLTPMTARDGEFIEIKPSILTPEEEALYLQAKAEGFGSVDE